MRQETYQPLAFTLSLFGLLVAGYLLSTRVGIAPLACGEQSGCDVVTTSPYAHIFGLPIAAYGVGFYLTMLILSLFSGHSSRIITSMFLLSTAGFIFTGYLLYLQQYVIKALCFWCISSAIVSTLLFVMSLLAYRATVKPTHKA